MEITEFIAMITSDEVLEFLEDHPLACSVLSVNLKSMMRNSATTLDDPKQAAKLCEECKDYICEYKSMYGAIKTIGEHGKFCSHRKIK